MLFIPILTVLLSQGLAAFSYSVSGEDGYYRSWRSKVPEMNQWSSMSASQMYFPFLQNLNPFSMWQPQPPMQQEDPDIKLLRDRQDAIFDILRCVAEEDLREVCKRMLGNAMRLFPEHQITTDKQPMVLQISTSFDLEPLMHQKPRAPASDQIKPKHSLLRPPTLQEKPTEFEITFIRPLLPQTEVPMMRPKPAEAVMLPKPMETVLETMESRPKEDETVALETVPIKDEPETLPTRIEIPVDPVKTDMDPVAPSSNSVEGQVPVTEATLDQNEPTAAI